MPRVGVGVGSDRDGHVVGARELRALLRSVPERRRARRRRWRSARRRGRSSTSSAAPASTSRTRIRAAPAPARDTFVRPSTVFALDPDAKPPSRAELERQRAALAVRTLPASRSATSARQGRNLPRNVEANPAVYRSRRDGAERRPPPPLRQLPRRRRHLRLLDRRDAAEHRAIELPGGAGEHLAALRRRRRVQRVVLVLEDRSTICRR